MKKIKLIIIIALTACFVSCSIDDGGVDFTLQLIPIEEVDVPDTFTRGETVTLTVFYFRPSDCHSFSGFEYDRTGNERTVSVVNVLIEDKPCTILDQTELSERSLEFLVGGESSYVFRFWQGRDILGQNKFLTVEIPVVQ